MENQPSSRFTYSCMCKSKADTNVETMGRLIARSSRFPWVGKGINKLSNGDSATMPNKADKPDDSSGHERFEDIRWQPLRVEPMGLALKRMELRPVI